MCSQEPSSIQKVAEIDDHIGCAMSGLTADAKTLIDHARAETQVRSRGRGRGGDGATRPLLFTGLAGSRPARCCDPPLAPSACGWQQLAACGAGAGRGAALQLPRPTTQRSTRTLHPPPSRAAPQSHRFSYNEPMPLESCTQSLCDLALQFGEDDDDGGGGGMVRACATGNVPAPLLLAVDC